MSIDPVKPNKFRWMGGVRQMNIFPLTIAIRYIDVFRKWRTSCPIFEKAKPDS
jgi:hypothetical protein